MMNGAEIPFRRSRRGHHVTGSLIFDREREEIVREAQRGAGRQDAAMRVWRGGRFQKAD